MFIKLNELNAEKRHDGSYNFYIVYSCKSVIPLHYHNLKRDNEHKKRFGFSSTAKMG